MTEKKLLTKTQLKEQMRLKPAPGQQPAGRYYSSLARCYRDLYDPDEAVPMRPYREPSAAQLAALERARKIECPDCLERFERYEIADSGACEACDEKRTRSRVVASAARALSADPVFLDVETTGLDSSCCEVVEIAVLDKSGRVLINTLVNPGVPIPKEATEVHGITDADVASAPTWADIEPQVLALLEGRIIVAHNCDFDCEFILRDALRRSQAATFCTMHEMAPLNYGRWPTLERALWLAGADNSGIAQAHRAAADAEKCRRIVCALAAQQCSSVTNLKGVIGNPTDPVSIEDMNAAITKRGE